MSSTAGYLKNGSLYALPALLILVVLILSAPAHATEDLFDLPIESLLDLEVVTASKKAEGVDDAPGIVSVITREEILGYAEMNLGQVLNRVVGGIFISANVFTDNLISLRGMSTTPYNNHILILLNGRPIREPISGGLNATVYSTFPVNSIERIEVIRGPGSVLYGSCAYAGVINVLTRSRVEDGGGGELELGYGSYDTFAQEFHGGFKNGDFKGDLGIFHLEDDGPLYEFTDYDGVHDSANFFRESLGIYADLAYKDFSLMAFSGNFDPYALDGANVNWRPETGVQSNDHDILFLDGGYNHSFNEMFSLDGHLTYNDHQFTVADSDVSSGDGLLYLSVDSLLLELTGTIAPSDKLNILAGGTYEKNDYGGDRIIDGDDTTTSFYTQIDYTVIERLKLIGGIQYNKITGLDADWSPRLGLIGDFSDKLGGKLLYSSAFRRGYPLETSFDHPVFRGNLGLEPELIDTFEAQLFYQEEKIYSAVTYFNSEMSNIIIRRWHEDPTNEPYGGYLQYDNGDSHDFWGMEWEGKFSATQYLLVTSSVTYQENETSDGIENSSLHPNWMAKLGLLYQKSRFSLGVFDSYFGDPTQVREVNPDVIDVNPDPEAYHLLSARATYKIPFGEKGRHVTFLLQGDNLLDEDIRYPEYTSKGVNSLIPLYEGIVIYGSAAIAF